MTLMDPASRLRQAMFQMCLIVVFYFYFPADVVFPGQGAMDSPGSNVGITVVFDAAPVITHAPSGDVRGSAAPIFDKCVFWNPVVTVAGLGLVGWGSSW